MKRLSRVLLAMLALPLLTCGGGPTEPPTPTGTPAPTDVHTVTVTVFEDENRNGRIDADETLWVPDVEVEIAGRVGRSEKRSGRTTVSGVARGSHTVGIRPSSLPPYYQAGPAVTVESPQAADANVKVPVMLPIGSAMIAGKYLASGDSISQGESHTGRTGFRPALQERLLDHFGRGEVHYRGGGGDRSTAGAQRMERDLSSVRPAYTMLNWGVNDYHEEGCSIPTASTCPASNNLKSMVQQVRAFGSLPCLVTIIPCNTTFDQCPAERITWVRQYNDMVRTLARQERVLVIDAGDAFLKAPNLTSLFVDHVHPNDAGYALLADVYYEALTHGAISSSSQGAVSFGFSPYSANALR